MSDVPDRNGDEIQPEQAKYAYYHQQGQQDIPFQHLQPFNREQHRALIRPHQQQQFIMPRLHEEDQSEDKHADEGSAEQAAAQKASNEVQVQPRPFAEFFYMERPRFRNRWAIILFFFISSGFVAVSGLAINGYRSTNQGHGIYNNDAQEVGLNAHTIILFAFVLAVALVLSSVQLWTLRLATELMVWAASIIQVVLSVTMIVVYFIRGYHRAAVVFLVFGAFYILCLISWIRRMTFSVLMLQKVIETSSNYGHVYVVSFVGGIAATAIGGWFSVALVSIYAKYQPGSTGCEVNGGGCSKDKVIGLIAFITFAAYWITEVLKTVIYVTISGVYGSWFFYCRRPSGSPAGATWGSFTLAMYSFGSLCFGSLFVPVLQFLRHACSITQQLDHPPRNRVGRIFFHLLGWLLNLLDWAMIYVNEYAFTYLTFKGTAYFRAAAATRNMIRDHGINILVNQCVINPVLTMGAMFVGSVCSFLAYLYLEFTEPAYNSGGGFTPVVMTFAFLIGLQICNIFLLPIKSGITTYFLAIAFAPEVLQIDHADFRVQIFAFYPHLSNQIIF